MTPITVGRRIYTWRYASVNDTTGQAITIPDGLPDMMEVHIHIEGSTEVCTETGESFTGSGVYHHTSDGITIVEKVACSAGSVLCTIKAPTSGTVDVSVKAFSRLDR